MPDAFSRPVPSADSCPPGLASCVDEHPGPDSSLHQSVLLSQLQLIDANLPVSLIGGCLTAFFLVWLVWLVNPDPLDKSWWETAHHFIAWLLSDGRAAFAAVFERNTVLRLHSAVWLAAYVLLSVGCWMIWRYCWRRTRRVYTCPQSYRVLQMLALMIGLAWGLGCGWLFQSDSGTITLGMVSLLGGMSGGLLSGVGVRARLYWLVSIPMAIGLIGALLYYGAAVNPVLPVALLALLISNGIFAHNIERHIRSAIELRFENLALVGQLRERTWAAEQANLAKSTFLASASHDLRQPVHALNLFLESLSTTRLDARQDAIVTHAKAASRASREMLDTLLDFSRIEAGVMEPKPCVMPLADLLRQLEDEFGPQADNKGLVYRSRDCFDHVYCDPSLLSLILRNLVSNAIRYTGQGGVLVAVRSRGADRMVEVWDTGIGIEAIHHQEIFNDFHQVANQERDHRKGLGLGLAIVRRLVDVMGLQLSLASRFGKGSVFSLRLPGAAGPVRLADMAAPGESGWDFPSTLPFAWLPLTEQDAGTEPLQSLRVLVVDDEVLVLEGMRTLLGAWGCEVLAFRDIEEATRHVLTFKGDGRPFDLLITDYRLQNEVTGRDVIRAVRGAWRTLKVARMIDPPSIIITGDTDPARIFQAQGVGATLLHKPIDTQVLYDELAKAFALKKKAASSGRKAVG